MAEEKSLREGAERKCRNLEQNLREQVHTKDGMPSHSRDERVSAADGVSRTSTNMRRLGSSSSQDGVDAPISEPTGSDCDAKKSHKVGPVSAHSKKKIPRSKSEPMARPIAEKKADTRPEKPPCHTNDAKRAKGTSEVQQRKQNQKQTHISQSTVGESSQITRGNVHSGARQIRAVDQKPASVSVQPACARNQNGPDAMSFQQQNRFDSIQSTSSDMLVNDFPETLRGRSNVYTNAMKTQSAACTDTPANHFDPLGTPPSDSLNKSLPSVVLPTIPNNDHLGGLSLGIGSMQHALQLGVHPIPNLSGGNNMILMQVPVSDGSWNGQALQNTQHMQHVFVQQHQGVNPAQFQSTIAPQQQQQQQQDPFDELACRRANPQITQNTNIY